MPLKNRNNEIIMQYLTDSTVVKDESPLVGLVGVSTDDRSDVKQMTKIGQDCPSVLIRKIYVLITLENEMYGERRLQN
jgi:hypothetical protein